MQKAIMLPYIKAVQRPVQRFMTNESLYLIESVLQVVLKEPLLDTTAWYKLNSRVFPGFFLETLSRASSAKDLSY